ncbi:MAG: type II toxin-antitoxin system HicA family toxin [Deltaproteobacteria bacterium]|nr:type II toxin-antitoxin system HicA family toxin [Deltaproteobacteria bacterium]
MVRVFEALGFHVDRTSGDHIVMTKPGHSRPLVIPKKDDLPDFVVSNNLRTARVSRKLYLSVLRGGRVHK